MTLRSGGLFAGYGGLDMAVSEVFGAEPAWFSEIDDAPSKILAHHWLGVPNHGDITRIDWDAVEPVDILSGGFPCQDVSLAGKRAGMTPDTRSGLWAHFAYAISKLRPRYVVVENVRGLLSAEAHSDVEPCTWCLGDGPGEPALRALGAVLGDLADLGYDAQWRGLPASAVGAPHGRYRIFVVASDADGGGLEGLAEFHCDTTSNPADRDSCGGHADGRGVAAPDAKGNGRHKGRTEPARLVRGPDAAERGASAAADSEFSPGDGRADIAQRKPQGRIAAVGHSGVTWGAYGPAIHRWERVLGRAAPAPTELNTKGSQRLSPAFVEWMMGLPAGHVTAVPGVNRNAQLKALGNGVVPQQAEAALRVLHSAALGAAA